MTGKKKKKVPTLIDVAKESGVSAITVSRTLREPQRVSKTLQDRIFAAVEKLGYVPNPAAATLASNRSSIIGMLVPSFSNQVFSEVLIGVTSAIEGTRFSVQVANSDYSALAEEAMIPKFLTLKPAGIIIAGIDQTEEAHRLLSEADCPVVQIMDYTDDPIDAIIGFSNFEASAESLEHMIDQGFRRIAFVGTRMDPRTQQRMAGYRSVMEKYGLFDKDLLITTPRKSSIEIGRNLLAELLERVPDCDSAFCNNDDVAVGVALECQRRNLRIPQDIGICGFNNLGITSQMYPPISSVHTPRTEIGVKAAQYIIDRNAGLPPPENRCFNLGYVLQRRASTLKKSIRHPAS